MDVRHGQAQVIIVHHINHGKLDNNKRRFSNKKCLYYFTLTGSLICTLLILSALTMLILKYSKNRNSTMEPLRIVSRKQWMAEPPKHKLERLELPVSRVIIAHTATDTCTTQADCEHLVRTFQIYHMQSRGWDDIGYNFLVGGDGAIYVGRGWDYMGTHTKGYNENSICFAFIGTFNTIEPSKRQLIAAQKMIKEGVRLKKLTADYALYGHRQFIPTLSPGTALYEIIKKWDHWTN